jgi:pimeloyl-ACP methyl ester carboxylesterase
VPKPLRFAELQTWRRMNYVLLPGLDGSGTLFAPLISAMGDAVTHTICYPPTLALSYAQLTDYAAERLPAGPCTLIAESFSGPIAVALAARFARTPFGASSQPCVQRVVLSCSFVRNPVYWLAAAAPMLDFMPMGLMPTWVIAQQLFNGAAPSTLRLSLDQAISRLGAAAARARLKAILHCDARAALAQTLQPLLYLQAAHDRIVPESAAHDVLTARKDAKLVRLNGPHCLLQSEPQAAWRAISAWQKGN